MRTCTELWHIFHDDLDLDGNGRLEPDELLLALEKAGASALSLCTCLHGPRIAEPEIQALRLPPRRSPSSSPSSPLPHTRMRSASASSAISCSCSLGMRPRKRSSGTMRSGSSWVTTAEAQPVSPWKVSRPPLCATLPRLLTLRARRRNTQRRRFVISAAPCRPEGRRADTRRPSITLRRGRGRRWRIRRL